MNGMLCNTSHFLRRSRCTVGGFPGLSRNEADHPSPQRGRRVLAPSARVLLGFDTAEQSYVWLVTVSCEIPGLRESPTRGPMCPTTNERPIVGLPGGIAINPGHATPLTKDVR